MGKSPKYEDFLGIEFEIHAYEFSENSNQSGGYGVDVHMAKM